MLKLYRPGIRQQPLDELTLSRKVYADIRALVPAFVEDTPFYEEIARVENYLRANPLGLK